IRSGAGPGEFRIRHGGRLRGGLPGFGRPARLPAKGAVRPGSGHPPRLRFSARVLQIVGPDDGSLIPSIFQTSRMILMATSLIGLKLFRWALMPMLIEGTLA